MKSAFHSLKFSLNLASISLSFSIMMGIMPNLSIKLRAISVGSENKIAYLITFCWVCLPALSKSISLANAFSISDPIKEAKIKFVPFSATKSNGPKDCDSNDIISSKPISYPFCLRYSSIGDSETMFCFI